MKTMKIIAIAALLATSGAAFAQTGAADNAAGIASQDKNSSKATSGSGSGTATSGGKDDNGDRGRDKMPDSNKSVKSLDEQNRNQNGSPK